MKNEEKHPSSKITCFFWRKKAQRVELIYSPEENECFLNYEIGLGFEGRPEDLGIRDGCALPPRIAEFFQSLLEKEGYVGRVNFIELNDEETKYVFDGDDISKKPN